MRPHVHIRSLPAEGVTASSIDRERFNRQFPFGLRYRSPREPFLRYLRMVGTATSGRTVGNKPCRINSAALMRLRGD